MSNEEFFEEELEEESVQEEEELTAIDQVNNILKEKGGMA